jgi:hypothetical protein
LCRSNILEALVAARAEHVIPDVIHAT